MYRGQTVYGLYRTWVSEDQANSRVVFWVFYFSKYIAASLLENAVVEIFTLHSAATSR
jgi:hypothetical protein